MPFENVSKGRLRHNITLITIISYVLVYIDDIHIDDENENDGFLEEFG